MRKTLIRYRLATNGFTECGVARRKDTLKKMAPVSKESDRSRRFSKACQYGMYRQLITQKQIKITCWMQQIDKELHTHTHTHNLWYYGNPKHVNPSLNFEKRIENVALPYQRRVGGRVRRKVEAVLLSRFVFP